MAAPTGTDQTESAWAAGDRRFPDWLERVVVVVACLVAAIFVIGSLPIALYILLGIFLGLLGLVPVESIPLVLVSLPVALACLVVVRSVRHALSSPVTREE